MSKNDLEVQRIESIFKNWQTVLGGDYLAYRNHVYRVYRLCVLLANHSSLITDLTVTDREKFAIAACFHDIGIWHNSTFDYLDPSIELANIYLDSIGKREWSKEISLMIRFHHKITPYNDEEYPLVDIFRKADWIDVSKGKRAFDANKHEIQQIISMFPNKGFHRRLIALIKSEFKRHPLKPLPMLKL